MGGEQHDRRVHEDIIAIIRGKKKKISARKGADVYRPKATIPRRTLATPIAAVTPAMEPTTGTRVVMAPLVVLETVVAEVRAEDTTEVVILAVVPVAAVLAAGVDTAAALLETALEVPSICCWTVELKVPLIPARLEGP